MKKRIVIIDDDPRNANRYKERIEKLKPIQRDFEVQAFTLENQNINTLLERQVNYRKKAKWFLTTPNTGESDCVFDQTAILIIDYDLVGVNANHNQFFTGEIIAYLARCFSNCGLIVGLNTYGRNPFDLTLKDHPESYADLNIGSDQIDNSGLWCEKFGDFRPWHWPILPEFECSFVKRAEDAGKNLDESVMQTLGISDSMQSMSNQSLQFISGNKPQNTTFRDFVFKSGYGLRGRDISTDRRQKRTFTSEILGRISAAGISKWLEKTILPGQDILVDAPHLATRYPSLLKGDHKIIGAWDKSAGFKKPAALGINHTKIETFRFKKDYWLSRPAWDWYKLKDYGEIDEVNRPFCKEDIRLVFCEDTSRFSKTQESHRFLADFDSIYRERFIKMADPKVDYQPAINLFKKGKSIGGPEDAE